VVNDSDEDVIPKPGEVGREVTLEEEWLSGSESALAKNSPYADWYAGHTRTDHGGHDLPKAAIFDLDGTLLDSVDLHAIARW
jgi:hypothetical protein